MMVNKKMSNQNYFDALMEISHTPSFVAKDIEEKYKISKAFTTVCAELGFVTCIRRGLHKWILNREPTRADVATIKKRMRARHLHYSDQYKKNQLTIKAIKNPQHQAKAQAIIDEAKRIAVERTQPVPVQHDEPFYDNSNSKVMLILAVGAVLGFMIATLIWK
jgi:PHD/YefM family antitoxin component YafN of YafNO toxin-antitoxin module